MFDRLALYSRESLLPSLLRLLELSGLRRRESAMMAACACACVMVDGGRKEENGELTSVLF
jgi:hypothetical protein